MRKTNSIVLGGFCLAVAAGVTRGDTSLYDSGGFETSAGFSTTGGVSFTTPATASSSIYGQSSTLSPTASSWEVATTNGTTTGASTANIETSVKYAGSQAVAFTRLATDVDTYYAPLLSGDSNIAASQRFVDVKWVENVAAGGGSDPFMGITVFNGSDIIGYAGVDATTGNVERSDGGAALVATTLNVVPGTWNSFDLQFDYAHQVENLYVNSTFVSQAPFASSGAYEAGITDADISSFATNVAQTGTGTAYYDNYSITSSVPEPATMTILAAAMTFGLGRRPKPKQ